MPLEIKCYISKKSAIVKITSFFDSHNHPLTSIINEIALRFRKLTPKMLADIEKYVIKGRMDSGSIYPLLKHNYPEHPLYKRDLYNAVYKFQQKTTQAIQMLR